MPNVATETLMPFGRWKLPEISTELRKGLRPQGSELTEDDVGRILSLVEGFGRVQPYDVGKRVWHRVYGLVMENNEQRDERKGSKS